MAKLNVDFKQILVQHGERIGLGVAGLVAVILIVLSLFMPKKGFFSGSPQAKAKELDDVSNWVAQRLTDPSNVPGEADKPPPSEDKLQNLNRDPVDGSRYRVEALIKDRDSGVMGRRVPRVLPIDEAVAQFKHLRIQSYIFDDRGRVYALRTEGGAGAGARAGSGLRSGLGGGLSGPGGMGGFPGGAGGLGVPGLGARNEGDKKDRQVIPVALTELEKRTDVSLAEQVRPLRAVIIAGAFPFKQQLEEFRAKLGLRTLNDVLGEPSVETGPDKQSQFAFRFLGVKVQRRELDGNGEPLGNYEDLDLSGSYRPYVILTGKRFEQDDPELGPVMFPGLVMPRLMQFREENLASTAGGAAGGAARPGGGEAGAPPGAMPAVAKKETTQDQYPPIEKKLDAITKTLETIKGRNAAEPARAPERFRAGADFDIFAGRPEATAAPGAMPMPGSRTGPGNPGDGPGGATTAAEWEPPDHCLVRLMDVTVAAGKTYEYRMQIRMANPNLARKDVASPEYAKTPELVSPWSEKTVKVHVEHEMQYYAVDQKEWELEDNSRARYTGPYANHALRHGREIFLQAHRWLERVRLSGGNPLLFGEWTMAERFPVYRGEYIGRTERVEVPVWRYSREEFTIASDATTARRSPGIGVYFGYDPDERASKEAILVDFDLGRHGHERIVKRDSDNVPIETKAVTDISGQEALILRPDGRLMLLEGARDFNDKERVDRVKEVRKRIRDVKDKNKPAGAGANPFGGN